MAKPTFVWQIPEKAKRDRCGRCLEVFTKGQLTFKMNRRPVTLYRFPLVCFDCKNTLLRERWGERSMLAKQNERKI